MSAMPRCIRLSLITPSRSVSMYSNTCGGGPRIKIAAAISTNGNGPDGRCNEGSRFCGRKGGLRGAGWEMPICERTG